MTLVVNGNKPLYAMVTLWCDYVLRESYEEGVCLLGNWLTTFPSQLASQMVARSLARQRCTRRRFPPTKGVIGSTSMQDFIMIFI